MNTSKYPLSLSIPVSDDEGSTDYDYFFGPNTESEGEDINFGTHDQPQEAPPTPDSSSPAPN